MHVFYKIKIFSASALLVTSTSVLADHPSVGLGTGNAAPIITSTANTLPKGKTSVGLQFELSDNNAISDRRLIENAEEDPVQDVHSISTVSQWTLTGAFGVTDNFTIAAQIPFVERSSIVEAEEEDPGEFEAEGLGDSDGIGDLRLFGVYRFWQQQETSQSAAVTLGVKLPTGETNNSVSGEGRLDTELQPGSGSTDPFFGLSYSKGFGALSFDTNITYQIATEGSQDTDLGDFLAANAALSYRLNTSHRHNHTNASHVDVEWDLVLELNGELRQREDIDGNTNGDSGGTLVFLSPGIRATTNFGMSMSLLLGAPIVTDLNGLQSTPQWRAIGGVSFAF